MYNILITGVGAIIGYGMIRSLKQSNCAVRITGMDIYPDAVGRHWCDNFIRAVAANDPDYSDFLLNTIKENSIDMVLFGTEQEIFRVVKDIEAFKAIPAKLVLNNADLLHLAEDKWFTHLKLLELGLPVINSHIEGEFSGLSKVLGNPMLLKPRRSYASKGIQKIYSEEDFIYWKSKLGDNFMVQEIVGDDSTEYTAGVFGFGDGTASNSMVFQRKLSGEGATSKARVRVIPELEACINRLVQALCPIGPTNFQFRFHKGSYLLLEINPRISSSTSLRTAFGYNEAEMCIEYYLQGKIPAVRKIRRGNAVRFIEDLVIYDSDNF